MKRNVLYLFLSSNLLSSAGGGGQQRAASGENCFWRDAGPGHFWKLLNVWFVRDACRSIAGGRPVAVAEWCACTLCCTGILMMQRNEEEGGRSSQRQSSHSVID